MRLTHKASNNLSFLRKPNFVNVTNWEIIANTKINAKNPIKSSLIIGKSFADTYAKINRKTLFKTISLLLRPLDIALPTPKPRSGTIGINHIGLASMISGIEVSRSSSSNFPKSPLSRKTYNRQMSPSTNSG